MFGIINNMILKVVETATEAASSDKLGSLSFNLGNIIEADGITQSILSYIIVFLALIFLAFIVTMLAKIMTRSQRKRLKSEGHRSADRPELHISGDINAAIAMALYLHFEEAHDMENYVVTFDKIQRRYSPWNSKVYNFTRNPKGS